MEIKIGDVVEIKSGSPKMTVIEITGDNVKCECWNPVAKKVEQHTFNIHALIKADSGE